MEKMTNAGGAQDLQPALRLRLWSRIRRPASSDLLAAGLLVSIFLAVNLAFLLSGGISHGGDSSRYVDGAENLLQGVPLQGTQIFYTGYIALVAFCQFIGIGLPGVVAAQILLAALACVALFDLGRNLHGRTAGLIAAGLFAANPDIARWHVFILTDSLYISLVILSVWCVHAAARRKGRWYVLAAFTLLAAISVRPNGLFLMAAALVYLIAPAISRKTLLWLVIPGIILTLLCGAIIHLRFYRSKPSDLTAGFGVVSARTLRSLSRAPSHLAVELIHARPFYSLKHNLAVLATLPFLYLFALIGLKRHRERSLIRLVVIVIITHLLVVAATYADWSDGRYLLYILPLICLLSSCAIAHWIEKFLSRNSTKQA